MTIQEKCNAVAEIYREILGRNKYSQSLRDYCFTKYKDGKYYSDCSSSVSYSYKKAGFSFGILNTVGMYNSTKLHDVPVTIKNGLITNPEVLQIGDMLLFAGSDSSRKSAGYVGHVEMVGEISKGKVVLYGHGSGTPAKHDLDKYCKSRYTSKTSTALGNKGLIKVRRYFVEDDKPSSEGIIASQTRDVKGGVWNLRAEPSKDGRIITHVIGGGTPVTLVDCNGWSYVVVNGVSGWISNKALE